MFHNEHNPPHFHAEYQGQRGVFSIDGSIVKGNITSKTAKKLIQEWALLHQDERLCRIGRKPRKVNRLIVSNPLTNGEFTYAIHACCCRC